MSRTILITANVDQHSLERLRHISSDLTIEHRPSSTKEIVSDELWQRAEILYGLPWSLPLPQQVPQLRWVQLYSAGADRILTEPLYERSQATFTTASGVHAVVIPEYVFTMIQTWFHHVPLLLEWQQRKEWPLNAQRAGLHVEELNGKTIGIVGYGTIGRQSARLAKAYGMRILAMQRGTDHRDSGFQFPNIGDPEGTLPDHYYTPEQIHNLLGESDVVLIAVPLTPKTKGMFDETAFKAMKPTAFLINIARGEVCDEAALAHALQQKQIAGAALDVFEREPLPPSSPLWHMPNVFITPHISGHTPAYNERAAAIFEENLRRYLAGEPLYNAVNKEHGY